MRSGHYPGTPRTSDWPSRIVGGRPHQIGIKPVQPSRIIRRRQYRVEYPMVRTEFDIDTALDRPATRKAEVSLPSP
jgi:hypothetical protein